MIAFEVKRNGKRVCVAGAEDLAVLSLVVDAIGKLGPKTVPLRPGDTSSDYHWAVHGMTGRPDAKKNMFLEWKSVEPLKFGDVIEVKVIDAKKADRPKSRKRVDRKRA